MPIRNDIPVITPASLQAWPPGVLVPDYLYSLPNDIIFDGPHRFDRSFESVKKYSTCFGIDVFKAAEQQEGCEGNSTSTAESRISLLKESDIRFVDESD